MTQNQRVVYIATGIVPLEEVSDDEVLDVITKKFVSEFIKIWSKKKCGDNKYCKFDDIYINRLILKDDGTEQLECMDRGQSSKLINIFKEPEIDSLETTKYYEKFRKWFKTFTNKDIIPLERIEKNSSKWNKIKSTFHFHNKIKNLSS